MTSLSYPITLKSRNALVDVTRGIAMLLVVLGHTITGTSVGYENSLLYKIIWSLQMPLFFIISGYVTRYSKPITSLRSLLQFIKKRSLAYLLPWFTWTFVVRGIVFDQTKVFDLRYLLWHMDSGYWFLVSLWSIVIIFGISDYLSNIPKNKSLFFSIIVHLLFCAAGMSILAGIGSFAGLSFLSIKLSLYYLPLFLCGYLFGCLQTLISQKFSRPMFATLSYSIALAFWLIIITRCNFYSDTTSILSIAMRYLSSILGCIALIGILSSYHKEKSVSKYDHLLFQFLTWSGKNSLGIYIVHYFFLNLCLRSSQWTYMQGMRVPLLILNYALCIILTVYVIRLIRSNSALNKFLFWK